MTLRFEVLHSSWTADGEEFAGGDHVAEDASDDLIRLAAAAHAAGAIVLHEDDQHIVADHVEDDDVSKIKLAEAMGEWIEPVRDEHTGTVLERGRWSGPWQEGHDANAAADRSLAEVAIDVEAGEGQ